MNRAKVLTSLCRRAPAGGNHASGFPQVAAGENPLERVTDISQGHEITSEWEVKLGVGTRLPLAWAEMPTAAYQKEEAMSFKLNDLPAEARAIKEGARFLQIR